MSRCKLITRRTIVRLVLIIGFAVSADIAAEGHARGDPEEGYNLDASGVGLSSALSTQSVTPTPSVSVQGRPAPEPIAERHGNPLWAIPLGVLSVTRARPVFSSSRRSPAKEVAAPPRPELVSPPPPPPQAPEVPRLTLVGSVVSGDQGIAVFVDPSNRTVIRLKVGDAHLGWVLRLVRGRETTLEKNQRTVTLKLPLPSEPQSGLAAEPAKFGTDTGILPGLAPVNPVLRGQLPLTAIPLAPAFEPGSVPSASGKVPGL
jgi:hypothetical protein